MRLAWPTTDPATARRRRWSPTTASRSPTSPRRWTPTARCCARRPARRPRRAARALRAERDLPQALAAIDLALWDLAGRRRAARSRSCSPRAPPRAVAVNATIAAADRAGAAAEAAAAAPPGSRCVKVKVGIGDDAGPRRRGPRRGGPRVAIRVDANGAWDADEAVAHLRALAPAGLELARSRCTASPRCARVRGRGRRAGRDGRDGGRAGRARRGRRRRRLPEDRALRRHPGDAARRARRARRRAMRSTSPRRSTARSGIAAGLHCAAALAPGRACGLATLGAVRRADERTLAPDARARSPCAAGPARPAGLVRRRGRRRGAYAVRRDRSATASGRLERARRGRRPARPALARRAAPRPSARRSRGTSRRARRR